MTEYEETPEGLLDQRPSTRQPWYPKVPGVTVDRIDVGAGMRELARCGYGDDWRTGMVVEHSLQLWARGEEASAEKKAIDRSFHGIDLTSWTRVLAAAMAAAQPEEAAEPAPAVARHVAAALAGAETAVGFTPGRFPVTYAYDFFRNHLTTFLPDHVDVLVSRGEASQLVRQYCAATGQDRGEVLVALALGHMAELRIGPPRAEVQEALATAREKLPWLPERLPETALGDM